MIANIQTNMNPVEKLILYTCKNQKEFAEKVGEHEQAISRWKTGKSDVPLSRFLKWCEILNFNDWNLLFDKKNAPF